MMHYDHECPKRTALWSSNPAVLRFDKGPLTREFKEKQRAKHGNVHLVKRTIDKSGERRFTGNALLKGTQIPGHLI